MPRATRPPQRKARVKPLPRPAETLPVPTGDETLAAVTAATPQAPISADGEAPSIAKRPANYNARQRVATWISMRVAEPGITNIEIARRMGILPATLNNYIYVARKAGWLEFSDPLLRLEHEIIPKTIDNLNSFLDAKDKQVTIEVAKGTIFKMFQESKGISEAPKTILALKIEMPPAAEGMVKVATGMVVGTPRMVIDAELLPTKA